METLTNNWNYDDYLTYFLLFAANEDYEVEQEEIEFIIDRVGEEEYSKVKKIYSKNQETDHLEIINEFKIQHCLNGDCKEKVLFDLKALFHSDGRFSGLEQALYVGLKKLL